MFNHPSNSSGDDDDFQARRDAERERRERLAEKACVAAEWAAMTDDARREILYHYDGLDRQGRLEDGRYFDQWLAIAMDGYVGD